MFLPANPLEKTLQRPPPSVQHNTTAPVPSKRLQLLQHKQSRRARSPSPPPRQPIQLHLHRQQFEQTTQSRQLLQQMSSTTITVLARPSEVNDSPSSRSLREPSTTLPTNQFPTTTAFTPSSVQQVMRQLLQKQERTITTTTAQQSNNPEDILAGLQAQVVAIIRSAWADSTLQ